MVGAHEPSLVAWFAPLEKAVQWDTQKTALIITDMWDDHWCKSAARRVTEMAGPMNEMVKIARKMTEEDRDHLTNQIRKILESGAHSREEILNVVAEQVTASP